MTHTTLAEIFPDHISGYWGTNPGNSARNIRVIRNGDLVDGGMVRWDSLPLRGFTEREFRKSQVLEGDLLLTTSGNCGRVAYAQRVPSVTCTSNFVRRLRVNTEVADSRYVFHLMNSERLRAEFVPFTRGTTLQNLSVGPAFESIVLPLPSVEEQRRIAAILDAADALRTKRRQAITKLDALTQAISADGFDSFDSLKPLGEYVTFLTSGARGWAKHYANSGSRFVRSLDVRMNRISDADMVFVNAPDSAEGRRITVRPSDVLLTITGSRIGRVAVAPRRLDGSFISQHVAIIRLDTSRLLPGFAARFISLPSHGQRQIATSQYGQTKPGLNFHQIRSFVLPIPSIPEQREFLHVIDRVEEVSAEGDSALTYLDTLFASLQQRAFQGEL